MLTIFAFFALGGIVLLALWNAAAHISFEALVAALGSLPFTSLVSALAATLVSYVVLVGYDFLALRYEGTRVPLPTIFLASCCGYAIGNAVGLGAFSGGAVRYRVYSAAGLSPAQIARVVGFISLAFGVGVSTITLLGIDLRAQEIGRLTGAPPVILQLIAGACLALVLAPLAYWAISRSPIRLGSLEIKAPSASLIFAQLALASTDILAAAAVLWVLIPTSQIDFLTFAAIYASALILGVLTHVPGGLGVFEVVILAALGGSAPVSTLTAALLAYRAIYFLLPLLLSILLLAGFEMRHSLPSALGQQLRR